MIIYLCGFMGCGKSTVGKEFCKKYGFRFIDLDSYIEEKEKMKISEIFKKRGEPYFRALETQAISEISGENIVVATGGGALVNKKNAEKAGEKGKVVFLDVPFDVCYDRIKSSRTRPLVKSYEQLKDLYDNRLPLYKEASDVSVQGCKERTLVAEDIYKILQIRS